MKKGLLFIGIVITSMVMLFASHEAKSYPRHSLPLENNIGHSLSPYRISGSGFPLNHPYDDNAPVYKAAPLFSALSSTYCIRLSQPVIYFYQPVFQIHTRKKWIPNESSVLSDLLKILCRDIISPNAP